MEVIDELRGQVAIMLTIRREVWDTLLRNIAEENILTYRREIEKRLAVHIQTLPE